MNITTLRVDFPFKSKLDKFMIDHIGFETTISSTDDLADIYMRLYKQAEDLYKLKPEIPTATRHVQEEKDDLGF